MSTERFFVRRAGFVRPMDFFAGLAGFAAPAADAASFWAALARSTAVKAALKARCTRAPRGPVTIAPTTGALPNDSGVAASAKGCSK